MSEINWGDFRGTQLSKVAILAKWVDLQEVGRFHIIISVTKYPSSDNILKSTTFASIEKI